MKPLSKGQITRNSIVEKARFIFNEKGLDITLDMIAQEMGLTKGRITNHFPTKESLFQAITTYYEWQLGEYMRAVRLPEKGISLEFLARLISGIMDIQYENRCVIGYLSMVTEEKKDMFDYISGNYRRNVQGIRNRVSAMVKQGLLVPELIHAKVFPIFQFQYISLLTNWVISEQHYNLDSSYEKMKPVYLQGIMQCYLPYLTAEGKKQYDALPFSRLAKSN